MRRAHRLTLQLAVCAALGACSADSDLNQGNDPSGSTAGTNGSTTGSSTTGSTNGSTNGSTTAGSTGAPTGGSTADDSTGTSGSNGGSTTTTGSGTGSDSTGSGGSSSGGSTGDDSDASVPMPCMMGPTVGKSLLLIGDSYMAYNSFAFVTELTRLAKAAGALGQSDKYANRSANGAQMVGGTIFNPAVPTQYADEKNSDGHVKTVIMDGGGNDVLIGNQSCVTSSAPPENQSCVTTVNGAVTAATTLFEKMKTDGVQDVVYFFYPHLPGGGLISGAKKELEKQTLDYAYPLVKEACDSAPINCVFVDTRGLFPDTADQFQDGIHPTVPNLQKIAGKVWQAMVDNCIAQ